MNICPCCRTEIPDTAKHCASCAERLPDALVSATEQGDGESITQLLDSGCKVDARDAYGETALCRASQEGVVHIAQLLLDRGADVNTENCFGTSPLMCAAEFGNLDTVRLLLERGAQVDARSARGDHTALIEAAGWSASDDVCTEIAKLLLDYGADANA